MLRKCYALITPHLLALTLDCLDCLEALSDSEAQGLKGTVRSGVSIYMSIEYSNICEQSLPSESSDFGFGIRFVGKHYCNSISSSSNREMQNSVLKVET